jgi:L-ascorbate metabolism protein UlaG (beta-lactamase superfamily)
MLKLFGKNFLWKQTPRLFTFNSLNCQSLRPIPQLAIYLLIPLFLQIPLSAIYSQAPSRSDQAIQLDETKVLTPNRKKTKSTQPSNPKKKRVQVEWYGRSFIYLTTSMGVRIAINPFPPGTPGYQFPHGLSADVVLVSDSKSTHDGTEMITGNPMIFRGPVAVGSNKASGIIFQGLSTRQQQSSNATTDHNTVFYFSLDGMKFVHLTSLGHSLTPEHITAIGRADILFVPVGNRKLSLQDIYKIIYDLDPAIIIPIEYQLYPQDRSAGLRPIDPFIQHEKNIVHIQAHGFLIGPDLLPEKTTVVILNPPAIKDPLKP